MACSRVSAGPGDVQGRYRDAETSETDRHVRLSREKGAGLMTRKSPDQESSRNQATRTKADKHRGERRMRPESGQWRWESGEIKGEE